MKCRYFIVTVAMAVGVNPAAQAISKSSWEDISDVSVFGLIGWALVMPTARSDWEGLGQSAVSIGVATGTTQILKQLISSERPDNSDNDSFPSGHATFAFASASTLHRRYGWEVGLPAYALASLTGVARERSNKHRWRDVAAGAVIGTASGWIFTDAFNDKVQLWPWVERGGGGVQVTMTW